MVFLRQNIKKVQNEDQVCCIFNIQTKIHDKPGQELSYTGIWVWHGVLKVSCISNKVEPHHLCLFVQHHQNISDPLQDQFKVGAIFQAWFAKKNAKLFTRMPAPQWCC